MGLSNMDYAAVVGLFGISTAIAWRVVFVLMRGIEEFRTLTNERFDRQDRVIKEGFARQDARFDQQERRLDKQGERLDRQGALILRLVRDVGLLTGALIGTPGKEREKVGSRSSMVGWFRRRPLRRWSP